MSFWPGGWGGWRWFSVFARTTKKRCRPRAALRWVALWLWMRPQRKTNTRNSQKHCVNTQREHPERKLCITRESRRSTQIYNQKINAQKFAQCNNVGWTHTSTALGTLWGGGGLGCLKSKRQIVQSVWRRRRRHCLSAQRCSGQQNA